MSQYTSGEIHALVALVLVMDPEEINHVVIVGQRIDGTLNLYSCKHAQSIMVDALAYLVRIGECSDEQPTSPNWSDSCPSGGDYWPDNAA